MWASNDTDPKKFLHFDMLLIMMIGSENMWMMARGLKRNVRLDKVEEAEVEKYFWQNQKEMETFFL